MAQLFGITVTSRIHFFAIATLTPAVLLVFAAAAGGVWVWVALGYLTIFAFLVDELAVPGPNRPIVQRERNAAIWLSVVLALIHFPLLALAVQTLSRPDILTGPEKMAAFFAFGLFFGQVSNSNAHELIHRPQKPLFNLGKLVFISHLFGHHTSAHRLVHHKYVATDADPNSARRGVGFYQFALRAWYGSFVKGWRAESDLRHVIHHASPHPYWAYFIGGIAFCALAWAIGGYLGVATFALLASYATLQILLSDYVQHYGLRRAVDSVGKPEPVAAHHAWDAPHLFSRALTLNAPQHSDHHCHPSRQYPELGSVQGAPLLPHSLPVMGAIALFPRRWRKLMHPRLDALASAAQSDKT